VQVEPTWKALEQFVVHDLQNVFTLDALESSHPISIEVGHPDEIGEIFDKISYGKGIYVTIYMNIMSLNIYNNNVSMLKLLRCFYNKNDGPFPHDRSFQERSN